MIFNSINFLIFLPLIAIIYWITSVKHRWIILLIGSYFFYLNIIPVFTLLLAGVTLSTYLFTRLIDNTDKESKKRRFLIFNIVLSLLPLFFFKYFASINESIASMLMVYHLKWPMPEIRLLLPIGISFYTFMSIGYAIDVYNEEIKSEKNFWFLALFISFFPLILSGPIERANNIIPQFRVQKKLEFEMISHGFKIMLWGYFMKLVVADRVGVYVDAIFNNIPQHNGSTILFASILYPIQVYADLGGYSLIAIGAAKMLGINVMQNFQRPFFSISMSEFWRRWHISLISWLTDYIFTPLSFVFRKYKVWGIIIALIITFLISGIWHGASLTFIVWGLMQGTFLSIEALTNKRKSILEKRFELRSKSWYIISGMTFTFLLFAASLVFGRVNDISSAIAIYKAILFSSGHIFKGDFQHLIYALSAIIFLFIIEFIQEYKTKNVLPFAFKSWYLNQFAYACLIILILLIGVFDSSQFIYFQF